jgi:two-component system CheB/CheR fusion protein
MRYFRDPEAFQALEEEILPRLLQGRSPELPLRVWVPGGSTGEEAYSIVICLLESMAKSGAVFPIQMFSTDLSERAIRTARIAIYPETDVAGMTPERREHFFTEVENGYQVAKPVRDVITFARQNLLIDPPISRLDLISCRNVVTAVAPARQRQLVAVFHYALQPQGYLLMRSSERLASFSDLFEPAGRGYEYYSKKAAVNYGGLDLIVGGLPRERAEHALADNQELYSLNEDLATSQEELRSANEELKSVNDELQIRNLELGDLSDDLTNLLTSTTIPIVMLDSELLIRRFTTAAENLLNVLPSDVGRPVGDLRMSLSMEDVEPLARRVTQTSTPENIEVQAKDGCWYLLRVRPCRSLEHRPNGAVLFLVDIDQARRASLAANSAREFAESVVESLQTPLLVLTSDLRIRMANRAFFEAFQMRTADLEDRLLYEIEDEACSSPALRTALERLCAEQSPIVALELNLARKILSIGAHLVERDGERQILVAMEDITRQKKAEQILQHTVETESIGRKHAETELRALTASLLQSQGDERRRLSRELHDDLSQKIAKLQFDVETLEQQLPAEFPQWKTGLLSIRDEVGALSNDVRRIAYQLHPSSLDHLGLSVALRSLCSEFAEREKLQVEFAVRKVPRRIPPDIASSLYRVAQEALRNVAKHSGSTAVRVTLVGMPKRLTMTIRDEGAGFDAGSVKGNGGLGLISMQERVRLVHGEFSLKTLPGQGVAIAIQVPLQ